MAVRVMMVDRSTEVLNGGADLDVRDGGELIVTDEDGAYLSIFASGRWSSATVFTPTAPLASRTGTDVTICGAPKVLENRQRVYCMREANHSEPHQVRASGTDVIWS